MKKMTILLPLALILTLTACGEKKTDTAEADKSAEQTATPANAAPAATETAQAPTGGHPGKAIHDANCISCHDSGVYTRADHKMKDYTMLAAQVRRCDANLGSKLFDEDMDSITEYLNDTYYHFPKQ